MSTVVKVENISKKYVIEHQRHERYTALRDVLAHKLRALRTAIKHPLSPNKEEVNLEEFWALKDISFEVAVGDRLGIIGSNGAGKSTLLKVLSRITEPTAGRLTIYGRIASLLEVGTGFHPELTGRENIFLNGAVLGMSKVDIKQKFDEIVAFAEVEKFLDTPVKRYSSGMTVRLAFAVAAHLEPEILVIDEVLAVGDAAFQEKCLGKMNDVAKQGRTVLFVSHNMNAVEELCNRGLLLDRGQLVEDNSNIRTVISSYLNSAGASGTNSKWVNPGDRTGNEFFRPRSLSITDDIGGEISGPVSNNQDFWVVVEGDIEESDKTLQIGFGIYHENGQLLYWSFHTDSALESWPKLRKGANTLRVKLPKRQLNQGRYRIQLLVSQYHRSWIITEQDSEISVSIEVLGGLSDSPYWMEERRGYFAPVLQWKSCD